MCVQTFDCQCTMNSWVCILFHAECLFLLQTLDLHICSPVHSNGVSGESTHTNQSVRKPGWIWRQRDELSSCYFPVMFTKCLWVNYTYTVILYQTITGVFAAADARQLSLRSSECVGALNSLNWKELHQNCSQARTTSQHFL